MLRWLTLILVVGLAAPAGAAPKPSAFTGDARLEKRFTAQWKKATLADALRQIEKATGARLRPDPRIVDEPVMAAAKEVSARALLEQIAQLTHYTWVRAGGTPAAPTYRLYQDAEAAREEQEALSKAQRAVVQALEKELARYRELRRLPPERLQQETERANQELEQAFAGGIANLVSDPAAAKRLQDGQAVRTIGSPIGGAMLDLLDGLTPDQWRQLQEEEMLTFSTQPAAGERAIPDGFEGRLRSARPEFPFPKSLLKSIAPGAEDGLAKAEEFMQDRWAKAEGFRVTVQLNLQMGSEPVGMLRVSPEPVGGQEIPGFNALSMMNGLMITGTPQQAEEPGEDPAAREQRLAADPVLGKKATVKLPPLPEPSGFLAILGSSYRVADVLPAVEEAFGVRLLADAYLRQAIARMTPLGEGELPLYRVLDRLAGSSRRWVRDGDFIRLRSRTWAHDRRGEIPDRILDQWAAVRQRQGGFTLDNLAEIATALRDEQVESLLMLALDGGMENMLEYTTLNANRYLLRLYGTLQPPQRAALRTTQGLAARALSPAQQRMLVQLNRAQNRALVGLAFGSKPVRRPEQLAEAVLTLESQDLPIPVPGPDAPQLPMGLTLPGSTHTFRVVLPGGQRDEYVLMLNRRAPPRPAPAGA
jgi:hypothetical protein